MSTERALTDSGDVAHSKWMTAFDFWYIGGRMGAITDNLYSGVPLSPENAKFLAAIIDGLVKPATVSGKAALSARVKNKLINRKLHEMRDKGIPRAMMLDVLKDEGLLEKHVAISAINQRLDRKAKKQPWPVIKQTAELAALYKRVIERL